MPEAEEAPAPADSVRFSQAFTPLKNIQPRESHYNRMYVQPIAEMSAVRCVPFARQRSDKHEKCQCRKSL
jgi:hypothetical protein